MSVSPIFIDSNIWLYRFLADQDPDPQEDARKRSIAIALTDAEGIIVSTQVINEVCSVLIKRASLNEAQILNLLEEFENRCAIVELTIASLKRAVHLRMLYRLSFWDSLIVACAVQSDVPILYSEDMQHGLIVSEKLAIMNPFQ
jgi:predicted nucleic acid-binding protein